MDDEHEVIRGAVAEGREITGNSDVCEVEIKSPRAQKEDDPIVEWNTEEMDEDDTVNAGIANNAVKVLDLSTSQFDALLITEW